jgi:hypothetical protein
MVFGNEAGVARWALAENEPLIPVFLAPSHLAAWARVPYFADVTLLSGFPMEERAVPQHVATFKLRRLLFRTF